jgi:hypothetical protein
MDSKNYRVILSHPALDHLYGGLSPTGLSCPAFRFCSANAGELGGRNQRAAIGLRPLRPVETTKE